MKVDAVYGPSQMVVTDEPTLIDRLRRGERAALEEMIRVHQPMVIRLVSRLSGWSNETDDLVQETFVSAMKSIGRFEGGSRLGTWLTRIAINVVRHHHRTRLLRARYWKKWMLGAVETIEQDASQSVEQQERMRQVSQAVQRLPGTYREVIVLHYLEEMSVEEMTTVLSLSRSAIEVRLHRARKMLKDELEKPQA